MACLDNNIQGDNTPIINLVYQIIQAIDGKPGEWGIASKSVAKATIRLFGNK